MSTEVKKRELEHVYIEWQEECADEYGIAEVVINEYYPEFNSETSTQRAQTSAKSNLDDFQNVVFFGFLV